MAEYDYQLFVIGAGSGGVRAARTAASRGVKVAVAEDRYLGGTCVNVGCVPKKLYSIAAHYHEDFSDSEGFGWTLEQAPRFTWATLRDHKKDEISRLNGIYQRLLDNSGVTTIEGRARIVDDHHVEVNGQTYSAETILVAVGGWPWRPDIPGSEHMIDSNAVFDLPEFPQRFLVYGGGYIAVEFASIFNGLGADTTLVYRGELFLRGFDHEVREFTRDEMAKKGVTLTFDTSINRIDRQADGSLHVTLDNGDAIEVDQVLCATGRRPHFDGLGLDNIGVELTDSGKLKVDDYYRTATPSVCALGDIIEGPELTPVALAHAMRFVSYHYENVTPSPFDAGHVATAVFCHPNIGTVGVSEERAREQFDTIRVYSTSFRPMKHTLSGRDARCLMKLIVDDASDRVVGAHMVGDDAGELIQGIAIAVRAGLTKADFDATIGIHPTSAEEFVTMRTLTRH
ncbi:glutathione-disulfide reductase [Zymobacter palmae]|uniref:Pyruvate/2-oxoglutarate dehydrogenase complex n=1 Tax=Zymobacter palmae TaxID=33074 RepID=A0A348HEZ6_9GAMM|nr:glutathione-disulfide reductase [Zymobacter palmae]BBG30198.1 pyruvate/2-oxoglutarate dehydrogenase complex [Zymobacter palmae]